jgi:hypothetical protein
LRKLAAISGFRLFVSTTYDTLLDKALKEVESRDGKRVVGRAYRLEPPVAPVLDVDWKRRHRVVYRAFGEHAPDVDRFAVTDLLGCGFPDWLMRFLVRTLKHERLSRSDRLKAIADERALSDPDLVVFLTGLRAQIYRGGSAVQFVDELERRMSEAGALAQVQDVRNETPVGHLFISYAREDAPLVDRLAARLRERHLPVFLDRPDLRPGQDWERRIEQVIGSAAAVLLCVSPQTERRERGEYRREWALACEERLRRKPSARFLWPLLLAPLATGAPREVPSEVLRVNVEPAYEGQPSSRLLDDLTDEVRRFQTGE